MATWNRIYSEDPPVKGRVPEFQNSARHYGDLRNRSRELGNQFNRLSSAARIPQFQGEAADAFREQLRDFSLSVNDLPDVFGQVHGHLNRHRRDLEQLRKKFDGALARARTSWQRLPAAKSSEATASQRLQVSQGELRSVQISVMTGDLTAFADWDDARRRRDQEQSGLVAAQRERERIEGDLERVRQEGRNLAAAEKRLINQTVRGLAGVELGDLRDPNRLQRLRDSIREAFDGFTEFVRDFPGALEGYIERFLEDPLWGLKEALKGIGLVLAVVAAIAVVVVAIKFIAVAGVAILAAKGAVAAAGGLTAKGAAGVGGKVLAGKLLAGGAKALKAGKAVKAGVKGYKKSKKLESTANLATDFALHLRNEPHPFTGEPPPSGWSMVRKVLMKDVGKIPVVGDLYSFRGDVKNAHKVATWARENVATEPRRSSGGLELDLGSIRASVPSRNWNLGAAQGECRLVPVGGGGGGGAW